MPDWTIEPMGLARDLDELVALEGLCFTNPTTREMFRWEAEKSDVAHLYVMRERPDGPASGPDGSLSAAADRGPVVAYCAVWLIFDELHINTLAVHPGRRREGIASRLLSHVLADADRRGAVKATLEVRPSNEAARQLYARFGFSVEGVRKAYYRVPVEDALILWRTGLGPRPDDPREPPNGIA